MLLGTMRNAGPRKSRELKTPRKRGVQTKAPAPDLLKLLADRVRQARARRGMTRKQLARDSGVSERYLAQSEGGEGNISVFVLRQLVKELTVSINVLLFEGQAPPV